MGEKPCLHEHSFTFVGESSTEYSGNNNNAWNQNFNDGNQNHNNKDNNWLGARAVRDFEQKHMCVVAVGIKMPTVTFFVIKV